MTEPYIYLGPWEWRSDDSGDYWGSPAGTLGLIDLRSLPQMSRYGGAPEGVALFVTGRLLGSDYTLVGDSLDGLPTAMQRSAWESLVGVTLPVLPRKLRDILWATLTTLSDPEGLTCPAPIIATRDGRMDLHLQPHGLIVSKQHDPANVEWPKTLERLRKDYAQLRARMLAAGSVAHLRLLWVWERKYDVHYSQFLSVGCLDDVPLEPHTSVSDDFGRGNEDLDASANWSLLHNASATSDLIVYGERVREGTPADSASHAQYQTALSSDDHYAEVDVDTLNTPSSARMWGSAEVRLEDSGTNQLSCYYYQMTKDSAGVTRGRLSKIVMSTGTDLQDNAQSWTPGDTIRTDANGSTIRGFINGVQKESETDTSVSGVLYCGLAVRTRNGSAGDVEIDNFVAADVGGAPASAFPANLLLLGAGGGGG